MTQYLVRAAQIFWICVRHLASILRDRILRRPGISGPVRLRIALEQMSGSFLKFGQILSLQVDLLPRAYCDELLGLLDRVPPFSAVEVRKVFEEELGRAPEALYREFDYEPIAAASIGQVHRAVLQTGQVVAVKVQRPGIRQVFLRDGLLLNGFIKLAYLFRIQSLYFMRDPVREFNEWVLDELDYRREAAYGDKLAENARSTPTEKVPEVHWPLTTSRILTMAFLQGLSVMQYLRMRDQGDPLERAKLTAKGFDPNVFVSNVITNFVSDAFRFGIFHADLHPANLLILDNNVVGYVDFGIVGILTTEARRKAIDLTQAYVEGNVDHIYSSFLQICTFTENARLADFRRELERRSREWYKEPAIGGVARFGKSLTVAMVDLLTLCRHYGFHPSREMIKYIRSLFLADGLVSRLAPGLDTSPELSAICEDYLTREAQQKMFSTDAALTALADLSGWLQAGPSSLLRVLNLFERNELPLRTRITESDTPQETPRFRAFIAIVVWLFLFTALLSAWPYASERTPGLPLYLTLSFFCGWTVWMLHLLRRFVD